MGETTQFVAWDYGFRIMILMILGFWVGRPGLFLKFSPFGRIMWMPWLQAQGAPREKDGPMDVLLQQCFARSICCNLKMQPFDV